MLSTHFSAAEFSWLLVSLVVFFVQATSLQAINIKGLEVTQSPQEELVSLRSDSPLILSYVVCGSSEAFTQLGTAGIIIRISHGDAGGVDITPTSDSLTLDSAAEANGVTASLSNHLSSDFETCKEVLVRVWPDHPNVIDLQIDLVLHILLRTGSRARVLSFNGGTHLLSLPDEVTTSATAATTAATTITISTTAITTTATTAPSANTTLATTSTPTNRPTSTPDPGVTDDSIVQCSTTSDSFMLVSAILGSLLLVAVVIIDVLIVVMCKWRNRVRRTGRGIEKPAPTDAV